MRLLHLLFLAITGLFTLYANAQQLPDHLIDPQVMDDPVVKYWTEMAKKGDKFSQSKLARKYDRGEKVPQNDELAFYWYSQAAEQGHKASQFRVGEMLENGQGTIKNIPKAVYWYKQAVKNEHALAMASLAKMYELGKGVRRDFKKAISLYQRSLQIQPGAPHWIKASLTNLESKQQCISKAKTTLFSDHILCASRKDFRQSVLNAGGIPLREKDEFWFDTYKSKKLMSSSIDFQVGYTRSGEFALAEYTFKASPRLDKFNLLNAKLKARYGAPNIKRGSGAAGNIMHRWTMRDGIEISIARSKRENKIYLSYKNPKNYKQMYSEIEKAWQKKP